MHGPALDKTRDHVLNIALLRWQLIREVEDQLIGLLATTQPDYPLGQGIHRALTTIRHYKRDELAIVARIESED